MTGYDPLRAQAKAIRRAERAYRGHASTCGAGNGTCFQPACRCPCHPAARAALVPARAEPPPSAENPPPASDLTDRAALAEWLRHHATNIRDDPEKLANALIVCGWVKSSDLTDRLATALRETQSVIREMFPLMQCAVRHGDCPNCLRVSQRNQDNAALLAEYDAQTP